MAFCVKPGKKKNTGGKRPTMAITLGFLIENFFCKIIFSGLFYWDSHTNPNIFVVFPSELGAPVMLLV